MKNKKKRAIVVMVVIGVVVVATVAVHAFTGISEKNAGRGQLADKGRAVNNENSYQDSTEDKVEDEDNRELYKTDMQSSVTVGVAFKNPEEKDEDYFNFEVALNTHSVDLDGYDLSKMTSLNVGDEIEITKDIQWTMVEGGGHHVSGTIKVPRQYEGEKIDYKDKEYIRLEIMKLDGINSRVFEWKKDLFYDQENKE